MTNRTAASRAVLAAFLVALPGAREVFAQTLGRIGVAAEAGSAGSVGSSLGGLNAAPALGATLSPASVSLAPSLTPSTLALTPVAPAATKPGALAPSLVPAALKPAKPAASVPGAKGALISAGEGAKALVAPALTGGGAKSAAAKPFDGSGEDGGSVPSALTPVLAAATTPEGLTATAAELASVRKNLQDSYKPGSVIPAVKLFALGAPAGMAPAKTAAVVTFLIGEGRLVKLTPTQWFYTELPRYAGAAEGAPLQAAYQTAFTAIGLSQRTGSANATKAVGNMGDALKALAAAGAPAEAQAEALTLYRNLVLMQTRSLLEDYGNWLDKQPGSSERSKEMRDNDRAKSLLAGRVQAHGADPVAFHKEDSEWFAAVLDKINYTKESKAEQPDLAKGVDLYQDFHRGMPLPGDKAAAGAFDTAESFAAKLDEIGMPEHVRKVATKEYEKMAQMNPKDSETQKVRSYLEWLVEIPWSTRTTDRTDIAQARATLDADHSGLDAVKERVLEFLAIRKKTGSKKGAIIAFTGPPGVGKTSIASAIAQALGRKFVRLSLGGVHDESVIRGHGRTYVGSMPGEIMRQMKNAGTVNPVMLLDESDKIGRGGNSGDPTAALLEVLDPQQNNTFRDRYLDVAYDLSEVLFIVTSNDLENIPAPLRDRMEIIEFDGYTTLEKIAIAQKHVVPEKRKLAGLADGEAVLTPKAIRAVIEGYTAEAGVRGLREKIEALFRKISAWTETKGEKAPAVVDDKDIPKYLGVPRFSARTVAENGVGVATGLAVSGLGGSTLNVEVSQEPGTGQLKLRKQFGDDIEDSAKNAYKYVKTHAAELGLKDFDFTKVDVDINITPAGKVDGPSAGGLMVTAIVSALTGRPVKAGLAMTGEITMRGDILPIGGLKQKVMAAQRMGYKEVVFPFANLKDIENIPEEVRATIKLTPAKTYSEIFAVALEPAPAP